MLDGRVRTPTIALSAMVVMALSGCGGGGGGRASTPGGGAMPGTTMQAALLLPRNHGVTAGEITLRPGDSREHGNVVLTCPFRGGTCEVTVAADGTASYDRTGGIPSVMAAQAVWALPANHDVSPGELTLRPGESSEHGNVVLSCPAGGGACVVTVAVDGTASYDRTGGIPSVMAAQAVWMLPANHDVSPGELTLQPGEFGEHGNVVLTCPVGGGACVVTVAADGAASYERTGGVPSVMAARAAWMLPANHDVSPGELTLQPGESREHGNVVLSCPAGGGACVVTVVADGTASYERTGGIPAVMAARAAWMLPANHGVSPGELTLRPGESREHGNVVLSCPAGGGACVVTVVADGTASYERTGGIPAVMEAQSAWMLPANHGVAPGELTLEPGESREHGNVVLSCPAGGGACVVTVVADGTASYERTGGIPAVMAARAAWMLPANHGVSPGELTLRPGESREHGNVVLSCPAGAGACVVTVAADGTASYQRTGGIPAVMEAQSAWMLPTNHGVAPGELTLRPGESREHGNVVLSCPAGGGACVVTVVADGTASYERTGGIPAVMAARAAWMLPANHGVSPGELTLRPRESREHGNVVLSCPAGAGACVVTVAADGGASYERTGGVPAVMAAQSAWILPANHDVSPGELTLQPGESREHGNVVLSCPAGGGACVVTVVADGSASYERTGGVPAVMAAQSAWILPANHDVSPGELTLQPGESREHGNVVLSCPAGGGACVVTVVADGSASYERTGGVPAVMAAQASWALPSNHGVSPGELTLQPGESCDHGNVVLSCPAGGGACVVTVAADGTASYHRTGGTPEFMLVAPEELPELEVQQPRRAILSPLVALEGALHVGADVAPHAGQLTAAGVYHGVAVSSGTVQDGVGAARVLEYLAEHVSTGEYKDNPGLEGYVDPPVVRIAEGTDEEFAEYVVRAVRLVNAALPPERRVMLSTEPAPPLATLDAVPDGQIFVDFAPWAHWTTETKPPAGEAAALAVRDIALEYDDARERWEARETRASRIWVDTDLILRAWVFDPRTEQWERKVLDSHVDDTDTIVMWYTEQANVRTVAHELLHTLGFGAHVDPVRFANASILNEEDLRERIVRRSGSWGRVTFTHSEHAAVPGHVLFPLDREALLAALDRFGPGTQPEELTPENLGPWDDTSFHLLGEMDFPGGQASFGVAERNGLAHPWASGPAPWTDLADNPALEVNATWNGGLLGLTPDTETVAGAARLSVELTALAGQLEFTGLEQWGPNEAPGATGSGITWGDGDLGYAVEVQGNTFVRTGGDNGVVTGAFFGAAHEAMGGALERDDLTAGFGGLR